MIVIEVPKPVVGNSPIQLYQVIHSASAPN